MKEQTLIHVRIENSEAINSKKDILETEVNLLRIAKIIKNYHSLRSEELKTKLKIHRKFAELSTTLKKLSISLPKIKIPRILKKEEEIPEEKIEQRIQKVKSATPTDSLEEQLAEINRRLKELDK